MPCTGGTDEQPRITSCSKKIAKYVLPVVVLLSCSFLVFGIVDYNRFFAGKEPVFIVKCDFLNDGGTKIYYGIGY